MATSKVESKSFYEVRRTNVRQHATNFSNMSPSPVFPRSLAMTRFLLAALCGLFSSWGFAADAKVVKIVHVETGKYLAVEDNSDEAAAKTVLAKDGDGEGLQWTVEKDGEHIKLTNKKSGKVLDVNENSKDEDASIIQYDDKSEGNDNQRWKWVGTGDEKRLVSKWSSMAVVPDAVGKLIQKKVDEKAKTQLWKIVDVKK
jgi:Ricin-type beta-trefoil lectin domain-like